MRKSFSVAMMIVGAVIGAGFCSGREILSFFGTGAPLLVAPICGVCLFLACVLLLGVGGAAKKDSFGQVNRLVLGRAHGFANALLLCNNTVVLGAMIAGLDALCAPVLPVPAAGVAAAVLCVAVSAKGVRGIAGCNAVVVPLMVLALVVVSVRGSAGGGAAGHFRFASLGMAVLYCAMNMILSATVLTCTHDLTKRQIVCGSLLAAAVLGVLLGLLLASMNAHGAGGEMPVLEIATQQGGLARAVLAGCLGLSIFTTMLAAVGGLAGYLQAATGDRLFSGAVTLLAGAALSRLGFGRVVSLLYPLMGVLGLVYLVFCALFLRKSKKAARHKRAE